MFSMSNFYKKETSSVHVICLEEITYCSGGGSGTAVLDGGKANAAYGHTSSFLAVPSGLDFSTDMWDRGLSSPPSNKL